MLFIEAEGARLSTAFTYDFSSDTDLYINRAYRAFSYHATFDKFIPAIRSGIGVSVHRATVTSEIPWGSADEPDIRK